MLGLDMGSMQQQATEEGQPQQQPEENKAKKLLKGLLGR